MTNLEHIAHIDSPAALAALCEELRSADWIALDTEFLRDRTYFPKFCLLQVATADRVACIDPLSIDDLSSLYPILDNPRIVKVFHAARQDLEILFRLRGRLPRPIFDTQLAAPYIGLPEQLGYASLVSELLGARLDKSHTRTDWSARPLSEAQIRYAAEDVVYLGLTYHKLAERLDSLQRRAWADEEMETLSVPELYDPAPEDAWTKIGGSSQLNKAQATLLAALAAWRERLARTQDSPRNWIVKDDVLLEVARQRPRSAAELKRIRGVDERIIKRFSAELLSIVTTADDLPAAAAPTKAARPNVDSPSHEALLDVFSALLRLKGAEASLNPALIASRRELRDFIADPEHSRLLQGWRAAVAGRELMAMLNGEKSLRVVAGVLQVSENDR